MASIMDILSTQAGDDLVTKTSEETDESKEKVISALGIAMPVLLSALKKNSQTKKGSENLSNALDNDKHNGDLLTNLKKKNSEEILGEGSKILDHILGGNQDKIVKSISSILGMNETSVNKILRMTTPVIMSVLGSQKRKDHVKPSGITDLINSVLGSSAAHDSSLIDSLTVKGDANIINDIAEKALHGGKKDKKGGSILGGFTGGK